MSGRGGQHDGRVDVPDLVRAGRADQFAHSPVRAGDRVYRQGEDILYIGFVGAADNKLYGAYLEQRQAFVIPLWPPPVLSH